MQTAVMQMEAIQTEVMQMAAMQTEVMQMAYRKRRASMQTATALRMVRTVTAIYRLVNVVSTGSPLFGSL